MKAEDIISKLGELPAMSHVASQVIQVVSDPDASAKDLQNIIEKDQALTSQILKISNSAMFGLMREVRTLTHAIMILGFSTIRSVVIASSSKHLYRGGKTGFKEQLLWLHSVSTALISRFLALKFSKTNAEEAFIGGLMHDVGKTILNKKCPNEYTEIIQEAYNGELPFIEAEKKHLSFDHTEVGSLLIRKWNLSESLEEAVKWHHQPMRATDTNKTLTALIGLANQIAVDLEFGIEKGETVLHQREETLAMFKMDEDSYQKLKEEVEEKLQNDIEMLKGM